MKYDILFKYKVKENVYDELFSENSEPRENTQIILNRLRELGSEEEENRRARLKYNQYYQSLIQSDNETDTELDSIPLIISKKEWETIERGIKQRAELYNCIAKDIYSGQKLIKDRIVPPSSVYANPDFLQMLWTDKNHNENFVNLMSTDIVRNKNGKFIAVNDKFQIPEGLGNSISNRLSILRAYPELLHDLNVDRLNGFFEQFRQTLFVNGAIDESAVLLASEPERNRRSEDAILARYLKLQLVENDDLSVRGFNVYLKTLTGLKKINTIVRRVEDGMCDPLELRIDSGEGAVGLISAVRSGNVRVVNSLGTGILESPIFRAFLPKLSQYYLKEDLIIEPVKAYWLGDEEQRNFVLSNTDNKMIYNAFGKKTRWIYSKMTPTGQLSLLDKVMLNPENYTAEEYIETSTASYVQEEGYVQGEAHFRFFASKTDKDCTVMPGGYGRVFSYDGKKIKEKDIWVLAGTCPRNRKQPAQAEAIELSRAGGDLPSRAADNLCKLGKNLEKAEILSRIGRAISRRLAERDLAEISEQITLMLKSWNENIGSSREFEDILCTLVMKKTEEEGLQPVCKEIRFLAMQLRDRLSEDTWQFIKGFGEQKLPEGKGAAALLPYLQNIIADAAAFEGLASESMTRGHGWRFLDIGRRIYRGILTLKMVKNMLCNKNADEQEILTAMLEVGDGSLTYFRRYGVKLHCAPVVDLLLCDETNPHSIAYQAVRLETLINELPQASNGSFYSPLNKEILKLISQLRLVDVYSILREENGQRQALIDYCEERINEFKNMESMLDREYLNHIPKKGIKKAMATEV